MEGLGPGVTVDRYRLLAPIGEGGQGTVWRAEDPLRPGVRVALKLVPLRGAPGNALERARREARALARLSHPSLPRCHALFEDLRHDVLGLALDFIDGSPLAVLLASESLGAAHRFSILLHLADALRYIHEAGLVHRDLKPQNVMIDRRFVDHPDDPSLVKLVDFGIAAAPDNPAPLTQTGAVIGTMEFVAPEHLDKGFWKEPGAGPERDVFALGVVAFQLLRGTHPTGLPDGADAADYLVAYRELAKSEADFPPGLEGDPLEAFYRACLALRVSKRAANGAAALELLRRAEPPAAVVRRSPIGPSGTMESARTEMAPPTRPPDTAPRRTSRLATSLAALGVGGVLFTTAFFTAYTRAAGPIDPPPLLAASARLEEPPNPAEPPLPSRPEAPKPALPAHPAGPAATFPANLTCPAGMVRIAGPPPFCIDKREVSVAEYRRCAACGPAKDVYWPGPTFTEALKAQYSINCTNIRPGLDDYPINCVSYQDAISYCAMSGGRLPRMDEWRMARSAVTFCKEVGGVCTMFEWSGDPIGAVGFRATRGPSFRHPTTFESSNAESGRGDDLGFRCAHDPIPVK